jgi:DNA-binding MurR/RpiR family transcriptional regulator
MLRPGCTLVAEEPERRVLDGMDVAKRDVVCLFDYRRYQRDTVVTGRLAAQQGATVIVFTDPWLSPAVEHARHVLISHADAASPFDSLLGAFALTELIAAKVVAALGEDGKSRAGAIDDVHREVHGVASTDVGSPEAASQRHGAAASEAGSVA